MLNSILELSIITSIITLIDADVTDVVVRVKQRQ